MPKIKTKSSAKKRFRVTPSGLVKMGQAGKRHNMRKRPQSMIRKARGSTIMEASNAKVVKRVYLPNS